MTDLREMTALRRQLAKLDMAKPATRNAAEDGVRLWATRLYTWTKATEVTMEKQLAWLDHHQDSSTYEQRFDEWVGLLRLYEQACDMLQDASAALGEKVAA